MYWYIHSYIYIYNDIFFYFKACCLFFFFYLFLFIMFSFRWKIKSGIRLLSIQWDNHLNCVCDDDAELNLSFKIFLNEKKTFKLLQSFTIQCVRDMNIKKMAFSLLYYLRMCLMCFLVSECLILYCCNVDHKFIVLIDDKMYYILFILIVFVQIQTHINIFIIVICGFSKSKSSSPVQKSSIESCDW